MAVYWKLCVLVTMALFAHVFAQRKGLLGGWNDIDENNKGVQEALEIVIAKYNNPNQNEYMIKINKVFQVRRQVVSGMKYAMDVEASFSSCIENDSECKNKKISSKRCTFNVLSVPWENRKELTSSYCS